MAYFISLENVDFERIQTTLTLPSDESEVCFNVTILSDEREEDLELFSIVVFPSAGVMTERQMINITIMDKIIGKQLDYSNLYEIY